MKDLNNVSPKVLALWDTMNKLAFEIKFTELNDSVRMQKEAKLFEKIILSRGRSAQKLLYNDAAMSNSDTLFLDVTCEAYISSMQAYGQKDTKTGEMIPFPRLFFSHLRYAKFKVCRKLPDGTLIDADNPETKAREATAKNYLRMLANKNGIKGYLLPKRIRSSEVYKQELVKVGMCYPDAEDTANDLFSSSQHVDAEDVDVMTGPRKKGGGVQRQFYSSITVADTICERMDNILSDATIDSKDKMYIKYYFTKLVYKENLQIEQAYLSFIDDSYLEALSNNAWINKDVEVLADLLGIKYDTARKNLKKAEHLVKQS